MDSAIERNIPRTNIANFGSLWATIPSGSYADRAKVEDVPTKGQYQPS